MVVLAPPAVVARVNFLINDRPGPDAELRGFVDDLPVGLSFYGRAWSEPVLIELAFAYEQSTGHRAKPSFLNSDGI